MSNIIDFRKHLVEKKTQSIKETLEQVAETDHFIDQFSVESAIDIIEAAYDSGFDIKTDPLAMRDMIMVIEAIAGLLHRMNGDSYGFHDVTDSIMKYDPKKCEEMLEDFLKNSGVFT